MVFVIGVVLLLLSAINGEAVRNSTEFTLVKLHSYHVCKAAYFGEPSDHTSGRIGV